MLDFGCGPTEPPASLPSSPFQTVVIYEVNLTVEPDIVDAYSAWLEEHIRAMLDHDGFESAAWYVRSDGADGRARASGEGTAVPDRVPEGPRQWTVHYHLESRDALQRYLAEDAQQMRSEAADRFGEQVTTERRILESRQVFSHQER